MSALFRRTRRNGGEEPAEELPEESFEAIASLIANLEASAAERPAVSHLEFREYIRDRARSQDEVWTAIRAASRDKRGR